MAYPSFAKSGVSTVTFSQGFVAAQTQEEIARQVVNEADDGTLHVYTLSPATIRFPLAFQDLPASDMAGLLDFLRNPLINYAEYAFTYTDSEGNATEVYYVPDSLQRRRNASGTYDGELTLRGHL